MERRRELFTRAKSLANGVPAPRPPLSLIVTVVASAAMLVYGVVVLLRWLDVPDLIVFGIGSILTWFVIVGAAGRRALARITGALERTVVAIVDKRADTVEGELLYVVVAENEHGDRVEHVVSQRIYISMEIDDIGILFSKHGQVWGFHRVTLAS